MGDTSILSNLHWWLCGRHWRSSSGTQKTLTSGVDFTEDSLEVLGRLLPLQTPLPFLCTSFFAMRPRTWWRMDKGLNYVLLIVNQFI